MRITAWFAAVATMAGLLIAAPAHAAPVAQAQLTASLAASAPAGCVTLREAKRTFKNRTQTRGSIDRGLGTKGVQASRSNTEWRAYKPCRQPNYTYVHVIYVKQAGQWRTIYWNYSLIGPSGARQSGTWGTRA